MREDEKRRVNGKLFSLQYPRAAKRKEQGRGALAPWQGELRVLRAREDAAPAGGHYLSAGQGLDHQAHDILPQAARLFRARRSAVEPRSTAAQQTSQRFVYITILFL